MLTLDVHLQISDCVSFTFTDEEAILLNTRTSKYFSLEDVGARFWSLLKEGKQLRKSYQVLLKEYEVDPARLEQDLLDLVDHLVENGLVEIAQA
jgi:hypothetical protein